MVTKTGNLLVYDNFKIGIVDVAAEPGADKFLHLAFTEQDFDLDHLNLSHIFKVHEKQVDDVIELIRNAQGKKSIQIASPGDMPNGGQRG